MNRSGNSRYAALSPGAYRCRGRGGQAPASLHPFLSLAWATWLRPKPIEDPRRGWWPHRGLSQRGPGVGDVVLSPACWEPLAGALEAALEPWVWVGSAATERRAWLKFMLGKCRAGLPCEHRCDISPLL